MQLIDDLLAGNRRALARTITLVENDGAESHSALATLYRRTGQAHIIGITGAPGTGKSTLVNALAKAYRQRGYTVGIVAVDPKIIPLRSQVYIPSYGFGDALDTGSAVRSRRIDLGYSDANLVLRRGWIDVYLLWPPPPSYQITWVIPNYPVLPK